MNKIEKFNSLVVGGSRGIGATIVDRLINDDSCKHIYICDVLEPLATSDKIIYKHVDLNRLNSDVFDEIQDISRLYITAGIGRLNLFETFDEIEIKKTTRINLESISIILSKYYSHILSDDDFYTMVISSIAGHIVSPLYALYSSTKAGLSKLIQAINIELKFNNKKNRILEVSPGSLSGTSFNNGITDIKANYDLVDTINSKMLAREMLYIPNYDETFKRVINSNNEDYVKFGLDSYSYKTNRPLQDNKLVIGYLSGTFDMFHIGHLNLLRNAKNECDYLIVGVHPDASHKGKHTIIPFEDRKDIVASCKFVDKVIDSLPNDTDAYDIYNVDKIFVGGDYRNTERFNNYEAYLKDTKCKIVYFDYTPGISSTIIKDKLNLEQ